MLFFLTQYFYIRIPHFLKLCACARVRVRACVKPIMCYNAPWDLKSNSGFPHGLATLAENYISHTAPVLSKETHAHLTTRLIARRQAELGTMFELSFS